MRVSRDGSPVVLQVFMDPTPIIPDHWLHGLGMMGAKTPTTSEQSQVGHPWFKEMERSTEASENQPEGMSRYWSYPRVTLNCMQGICGPPDVVDLQPPSPLMGL